MQCTLLLSLLQISYSEIDKIMQLALRLPNEGNIVNVQHVQAQNIISYYIGFLECIFYNLKLKDCDLAKNKTNDQRIFY